MNDYAQKQLREALSVSPEDKFPQRKAPHKLSEIEFDLKKREQEFVTFLEGISKSYDPQATDLSPRKKQKKTDSLKNMARNLLMWNIFQTVILNERILTLYLSLFKENTEELLQYVSYRMNGIGTRANMKYPEGVFILMIKHFSTKDIISGQEVKLIFSLIDSFNVKPIIISLLRMEPIMASAAFSTLILNISPQQLKRTCGNIADLRQLNDIFSAIAASPYTRQQKQRLIQNIKGMLAEALTESRDYLASVECWDKLIAEQTRVHERMNTLIGPDNTNTLINTGIAASLTNECRLEDIFNAIALNTATDNTNKDNIIGKISGYLKDDNAQKWTRLKIKHAEIFSNLSGPLGPDMTELIMWKRAESSSPQVKTTPQTGTTAPSGLTSPLHRQLQLGALPFLRGSVNVSLSLPGTNSAVQSVALT